jgi:CRP-like cAMP-binding protein
MTELDRLRRIPLFAGLPQETLSRVASLLVQRTYAPDETIILEGAPCQAAYFLAQGHVRVIRTSPDGREQVLVRLGPGQSFNTVPPFQSQGANHATVRAADQVTVYAISNDDLHRLVTEHPAFALGLLRDFANRLDHLTDLVEDLSLRTVRGRLARFLLEEANAGQVTRHWTQAEIAARLGTVREMISRTLRTLADTGLIRIDRQQIVLLDREGLEAEAYR